MSALGPAGSRFGGVGVVVHAIGAFTGEVRERE